MFFLLLLFEAAQDEALKDFRRPSPGMQNVQQGICSIMANRTKNFLYHHKKTALTVCTVVATALTAYMYCSHAREGLCEVECPEDQMLMSSTVMPMDTLANVIPNSVQCLGVACPALLSWAQQLLGWENCVGTSYQPTDWSNALLKANKQVSIIIDDGYIGERLPLPASVPVKCYISSIQRNLFVHFGLKNLQSKKSREKFDFWLKRLHKVRFLILTNATDSDRLKELRGIIDTFASLSLKLSDYIACTGMVGFFVQNEQDFRDLVANFYGNQPNLPESFRRLLFVMVSTINRLSVAKNDTNRVLLDSEFVNKLPWCDRM